MDLSSIPPQAWATVATAGAAVLAKVNEKTLLEVYGDLAKPGVQQVGTALSTVIGLANTLLTPVKGVNDVSQLLYKHYLEKLRAKLESVPQEQIVEVAPEIGVPIMEKLGKTTNEKLSELYLNLLANASVIDYTGFVHPRFILTIESLTPDEVKILDYLDGDISNKIPFINISIQDVIDPNNPDEIRTYRTIVRKATPFEYNKQLSMPNNSRLCFTNLESLGLIQSSTSRNVLNNPYDYLEQQQNDFVQIVINIVETELSLKPQEKEVEKGLFELTEYGLKFTEACRNNFTE